VSCTRGGGIATNNHNLYLAMRDLVPLFEGFLTYGGMSVREIEAMAASKYVRMVVILESVEERLA